MRIFIAIFCIFLFQSSIAQELQSDSLLEKARKYRVEKNFSQALMYYLRIQKEQPDKKISKEIANFYAQWGMYAKAAEILSKTVNKEKTLSELADLKQIASWYEQANMLRNTITIYHQMLEIPQLDYKNLNHIYTNLTSLYKKQNQFEEALEIEKKLLNQKTLNHDSVGIMQILNNIGFTYKHLNHNKLAMKSFDDSYKIALLLKDEFQQAITLLNMATLGYRIGQETESIKKYLEKSIQLLEKLHHKNELIQAYNFLASIYLAQNELNKSKALTFKSSELASKLNFTEGLAVSYKILSKIYKLKHNSNLSYYYLDKFSNLKDSLLITKNIAESENQKRNSDLTHNETIIKELLVEKEMQELHLKKIELESQSFIKQSEILKRDQMLKDISFREKELKKEKEIYQLQLQNQEAKIESQKQSLVLLNFQKEKEEEIKQNKLKILLHENHIKELQLKNQSEVLQKQKANRNILITLLIFIPLIFILLFVIFFYRQNVLKIKLKSEFLDMEHRMLRSQMNPHFIFNALNSIQHFVSISDSYHAEKYFSRFSRLMRYILVNSSQKEIKLADEIQLLSIYVELEQLRFSNQFDFNINIEEKIDTQFVTIPPMIIQAYVENAIVHGLRYKNEGGMLEVRFLINEKSELICEIEDNGIGRKASSILNEKRIGHKSMAIGLSEERLKLLGRSKKSKYAVQIIDLYNAEYESTGTKVVLTLGNYEIE